MAINDKFYSSGLIPRSTSYFPVFPWHSLIISCFSLLFFSFFLLFFLLLLLNSHQCTRTLPTSRSSPSFFSTFTSQNVGLANVWNSKFPLRFQTPVLLRHLASDRKLWANESTGALRKRRIVHVMRAAFVGLPFPGRHRSWSLGRCCFRPPVGLVHCAILL